MPKHRKLDLTNQKKVGSASIKGAAKKKKAQSTLRRQAGKTKTQQKKKNTVTVKKSEKCQDKSQDKCQGKYCKNKRAVTLTFSMEGHKDNVALFYRPKENPTVKNTEWVEYRPTGQLTEGSTLDFLVSGSSTRYVDLARTRIRVQVRIVQGNGQKLPKPIVEDKPTPEAAKVGPVNLLLQSMFRQVDVSFQQQVISPHVSTKYPYKAYMETLLNFGEAASLSKLQSQLFYKDEGDPSSNDPIDGTNTGLIQRSISTRKKAKS